MVLNSNLIRVDLHLRIFELLHSIDLSTPRILNFQSEQSCTRLPELPFTHARVLRPPAPSLAVRFVRQKKPCDVEMKNNSS